MDGTVGSDDTGNDILTVGFKDLVKDPERTILRICRRLKLPVGVLLERTLEGLQGRSHRYRNNHDYGLERMGLTPEGIREEYREVYATRGGSNAAECHTVS